MAWKWPVMKALWSGFKWAAKKTLSMFKWAWTKPKAAVATGLAMVGTGWLLAKCFGWKWFGQNLASFGWTIFGIGATSWAVDEAYAWFGDNVIVPTVQTWKTGIGFPGM